MATDTPKPIHSLVLDAGPIIKNDPAVSTLVGQAEFLYTIPAVVDEIRDEVTRSRVQTTLLPLLTLRSPRPASIKIISEFARKTGDLEVLSRPDIHLMALAYELECERNHGNWRLRSVPGQQRLNGAPPKSLNREAQPPAEESSAETAESAQQPKVETRGAWGTAVPPQANKPISDTKGVEESLESTHLTTAKDSETTEDSNVAEPAEAAAAEKESKEPKNAGREFTPVPAIQEERKESRNVEPESEQSLAYIPEQQSKEQGSEVAPEPTAEGPLESALNPEVIEEVESDGSDDEGWITPSNLKKHKEKDGNGSFEPQEEQKKMQVATITSDFAMQNVMLRMNLNLLSPSLQRIRQVKSWVLRCHACFGITKDMTRQFCGRCDKDGNVKVHLKKNMQWNNRGNVYSIPKPVAGTSNGKLAKGGGKGGWGQELILAEDQKEYLSAMAGARRQKEKDLMDENYLPSILTGDRGKTGGRPKVGAGRNVNSKKRR
ncbi:20S-pre-rRNA D-site endonuclease nob1 [Clarireedia jacksonii]